MIHSRSKGRPPRKATPRKPAAPTGTLRSTTNAKTRDPQQRALWLAAKRAEAAKVLASVDQDAADAQIERTAAPTSAIYRMVGTGHDGTGHRGKEVAKLLATGQAAMALRDRDAAGPLRENVGCTLQRDSEMDYLRSPHTDTRERANAPEGQTQRRADQIDRYELHTASGNC